LRHKVEALISFIEELLHIWGHHGGPRSILDSTLSAHQGCDDVIIIEWMLLQRALKRHHCIWCILELVPLHILLY